MHAARLSLLFVALTAGCSRANPRFQSGGGGTGGGTQGDTRATDTGVGPVEDDTTGWTISDSAAAADSGKDDSSGTSTTGRDSDTDEGSTTEEDPGPLIESPCQEVADMPGLEACWDFGFVEDNVVHDRSGHGHDLVFDTTVTLAANGIFGDALDAAMDQVGSVDGLEHTGDFGIEIWFRVDDQDAWATETPMLSIRDSTGSFVAAVEFRTFVDEPAVSWPTSRGTVSSGAGALGDSLCAASAYAGFPNQTLEVLVRGLDGSNTAPLMTDVPLPEAGNPLSLTVLTTGWGGVIDGVRVWSSAGFPACDPAPAQ